MKSITFLLFLLVQSYQSFSQDDNCSRTATFGDKDICLPIVEGYKECYIIPEVKAMADATEAPVNRVLGYYLSNSAFENLDSSLNFGFDDYFKFYGTSEINNLNANEEVLNEMEKALGSNFVSKNWSNIKEMIDDVGLGVDVGQPVVIKKVRLNELSFTFLMLTDYGLEEDQTITLSMSVSGVLLNSRLVWLAHYLRYENEKTIEFLEKNTRDILNLSVRIKN